MNAVLTRTIALLVLLLVLFSASGIASAGSDKPDPSTETASPASPSSITLPDSGSTTSSNTAFSITNNGTGRAGFFNLNNKNTNSPALEARTVSTSGNATAITATAVGSPAGTSSAAVRAINNGSGAGGYGLLGQHLGAGSGVFGLANGAGGTGVRGSNAATTGAGKGIYGQAASPARCQAERAVCASRLRQPRMVRKDRPGFVLSHPSRFPPTHDDSLLPGRFAYHCLTRIH